MLKRYLKITTGKVLPVHKISKSILISTDNLTTAKLSELWKEHEERVKELHQLCIQLDNNDGIPTSPVYPSLLDLKLEIANRMLQNCCFCARLCGINRSGHQKGYCGVGTESYYSAEFLHFGEEPELVPSHTIFFSGCTFRCVYCRSPDISRQPLSGFAIDDNFVEIIKARQSEGATNINLVGGVPDHHLHTILRMLNSCDTQLPVIWNSNMYSSLETMWLLEGVIDLYLANLRYGNNTCAKSYSDVDSYFEIVTRNTKIAYKTAELFIRHLVLPNHLECCTVPVVNWVAKNIKRVRFTFILQYLPYYLEGDHPEIARKLNNDEKRRVNQIAETMGLSNFEYDYEGII